MIVHAFNPEAASPRLRHLYDWFLMRAVACKRHPSLCPSIMEEKEHIALYTPLLVFNYFCAYGCFAFLFGYAPCVCSALGGHKRVSDPPGTSIPDIPYRVLLTIKWARRVKPLSSGKAASVLNR